jgi:hypothetical protein
VGVGFGDAVGLGAVLVGDGVAWVAVGVGVGGDDGGGLTTAGLTTAGLMTAGLETGGLVAGTSEADAAALAAAKVAGWLLEAGGWLLEAAGWLLVQAASVQAVPTAISQLAGPDRVDCLV